MTAIEVKQKTTCFIVFTNEIVKEDDSFVATCLELDIVSQGDTIEEASKNLDEAVLCYFNSLEDLGIREEVFKEKNITLHYYPQTIDNININVPVNLDTFITAKSFSIAC